MTTSLRSASSEDLLKEKLAALTVQYNALKDEVSSLRAETPTLASRYLASKVNRQSSALNALNRRVRVQRLLLRELNAIDPNLAETLFELVKDKYASELEDVSNFVI